MVKDTWWQRAFIVRKVTGAALCSVQGSPGWPATRVWLDGRSGASAPAAPVDSHAWGTKPLMEAPAELRDLPGPRRGVPGVVPAATAGAAVPRASARPRPPVLDSLADALLRPRGTSKLSEGLSRAFLPFKG